MNELHLPWLELAILVPLVGAWWTGRLSDTSRARSASLAVAAVTLVLSTSAWIDFESLFTFEAHDHWDVVRDLIGREELVIDQLNAPLLPLTSLLFFLTMLATPRVKFGKYSFPLALVSLSSTLAVLSCKETWMLIALLGLNTIPMYWDLKSRGRSTRVFMLHVGASWLCMLVGAVLDAAGRPVGSMAGPSFS